APRGCAHYLFRCPDSLTAGRKLMLQATSLATLARIRHAFFTRSGGVSQGLYASLNGGVGSNDAPEKVAENRTRMAAGAGRDTRSPAAGVSTPLPYCCCGDEAV